jgi:uncharacterized protein
MLAFLPGTLCRGSAVKTGACLDGYFTLIVARPREPRPLNAAHKASKKRPTQPGREVFTKIERLTIPGPAGGLESLLEYDPTQKALLTAVVCHPHPLYGGTMHNKVVFRLARAAREAGLPTLRFNFRGVGASQGTHDKGVGELEDVRAALDYLSARFPGLPAAVAGFSFGSWVGLRAGAKDARVAALVGLGLPADSSDFSFLSGMTKPKLIVQGTRDQYGRREEVQAVFDMLSEPKRIHWVEGAEHFFTGKLEEVRHVVHAFLSNVVLRLP